MFDLIYKDVVGWARFLAPLIMKTPEKLGLGEELEKSFCSTQPMIARSLAKATFYSDKRVDLPKVTTPTLII